MIFQLCSLLLIKSWKFIQALLGRTGKEGLKRMCTTLEASKIDLSLADVADKKYLRQHDLATITDISAGAATFYVWVSNKPQEFCSIFRTMSVLSTANLEQILYVRLMCR